jgi:adiponectin receptor
MVALPMVFYPYAKEHYPSANSDDWTLFGLFFVGGALCFALSTSYHALSNHSHTVHDICHRLDFLGIIVVTAGCFPPGLWYTFPCAARNTKILLIGVCTILFLNVS